MIDKKRIVQRLNRGYKLKEFPLLNLYILVAAFTEVLAVLADWPLLMSLRPLPLFLMLLYVHNKNAGRKFLVPTLVSIALAASCIVDLFEVVGDDSSRSIMLGLRTVAHWVYCTALTMGERIRPFGELRWAARAAYCAVFALTAFGLYEIRDLLESRLIHSAFLLTLSAQLCVALWRYEITLRSSFLFSLFGSALLLAGAWAEEWVAGRAAFVLHFVYFCGHYFLAHGSLHQSNLQFEINKLEDSLRKSYF